MDSELYARVRALFEEAIELPPAEREALLDAARERHECQEVLQEVKSLLEFHRDADRADS